MRKMKKSLAIVAGLLVVGAAGQALAETRFAVQDATGTVDKMVVTDSGYVGIGNSAPYYPFQVKAGGATSATTMELRNTGRPEYTQYDAPQLQFTRNNASTVNNGVPKAGDRLGLFSFGAYFGSTVRYGANVIAGAETSTGTSTSLPAYVSIETTSSPNTYPSEKFRVTSGGNVGIGTTAPTQKLEVKGGIRLNTTAAKPITCDSTLRGVVWITQGGTGTADSLDVCLKDGNGNYSWVKLN
jgi:hypothetical protein